MQVEERVLEDGDGGFGREAGKRKALVGVMGAGTPLPGAGPSVWVDGAMTPAVGAPPNAPPGTYGATHAPSTAARLSVSGAASSEPAGPPRERGFTVLAPSDVERQRSELRLQQQQMQLEASQQQQS